MPKMVFDEWYGTLTFAQRAAYRSHNVPPAMHDELVDYFGQDAHGAITAYVKAKGRNGLNYGGVYRDRPNRATGAVTVDA